MNFLITTTAKSRQILVLARNLYIGQISVVLLLLASLVACGNLQDTGSDTIGSGADSSVQPTQSGTAIPSQQDEEPTDSGCAYCIDFDAVAEEYEVNPIRAGGKYIDQRVRIRGGIATLSEREIRSAGTRILSVSLDNNTRFQISDTIRRDNGDERFYEWRNWLLTKDIGDMIEVECRVTGLASRQRNPDLTPGTPLISDCDRVVDGRVIVTPTAMPAPTRTRVPTPTLSPCVEMELSDHYSKSLVIDCPANRVVVYHEPNLNKPENFQVFSEGDSTLVWLSARDRDYLRRDFFPRPTPADYSPPPWRRWTERIRSERMTRELWEAPTEVATHIISLWRKGYREVTLYFADCCENRLTFGLRHP